MIYVYFLSRLHAQCEAQCGARTHHPEIKNSQNQESSHSNFFLETSPKARETRAKMNY